MFFFETLTAIGEEFPLAAGDPIDGGAPVEVAVVRARTLRENDDDDEALPLLLPTLARRALPSPPPPALPAEEAGENGVLGLAGLPPPGDDLARRWKSGAGRKIAPG